MTGLRSGAGGHVTVALGCAWPCRSSLPSHPSPRPGALPFGIVCGRSSPPCFGCPPCPITAITLVSAVNGQETRGVPTLLHPQTLPSRAVPIQPRAAAHAACRNQELHPDGGAQGSQAGKTPGTQVKGNSSPCVVASGLFSFCCAEGLEPGVSQPGAAPGQLGGDGEPFPPPGQDEEGPRGFLFNAML